MESLWAETYDIVTRTLCLEVVVESLRAETYNMLAMGMVVFIVLALERYYFI